MTAIRAIAMFAALVAAGAALADGPTTAPAGLVDNPQYAAWARCKVGSSVTMVSDNEGGGTTGHIHLEVTQTLKSITPDAVTLSHVNKLTVGGKPRPGGPASVQTIPAKVAADMMRPIGTADVTAMGRAFACHVYEAAQPGPAGITRSTAYLNDGVPGGVVKLVTPIAKGLALTFELSAMDAK